MADSDSERDKKEEDEIVSLKSRISMEEHEHPARKRQRRKAQIWLVITLPVTLLLSFAVSNVLFWPCLVVSVILLWIWQSPDSRELSEWRKQRLAEG